MNSKTETVEYFYGVYLLYCLNPQYVGRTYIGFTVDPNRRIKQHNKGKQFGGAWKTSNRGPWKMVIIIHGFPNDITALRFEWAWQHPTASKRLKHVAVKKRNEKVFDYCLRVLSEMLCTGPWNRLPLTIRWLEDDFARDFPVDKCPPIHMQIVYGPVLSKKIKKSINTSVFHKRILNSCHICCDLIETKGLQCISPDCDMVSHTVCLSKLFLTAGEYVPVCGTCPKCQQELLWGDLVRKYRGCLDSGVSELQQSSDDDSIL